MSHSYLRHIRFDSVPNFRDLGGYRTHDGRTVAWRRVFRSAAIHKMHDGDIARLKQEIGPRAVIDLRSPRNPDKNSEPLLLEEIGASYHPISFRPDNSSYVKEEVKAHPNATHMGELYLHRITEQPFASRLVDALEIIAERNN